MTPLPPPLFEIYTSLTILLQIRKNTYAGQLSLDLNIPSVTSVRFFRKLSLFVVIFSFVSIIAGFSYNQIYTYKSTAYNLEQSTYLSSDNLFHKTINLTNQKNIGFVVIFPTIFQEFYLLVLVFDLFILQQFNLSFFLRIIIIIYLIFLFQLSFFISSF